MDWLILTVAQWQAELTFGILLNLAMTFGFGFYKVMNLSYAQTVALMEKYPVKPSYVKVAALWLIPFAGTFYIFRELLLLQRVISGGGGVYEYLEVKLSNDYARQRAENRES